jgi:hypothetical protein
MFVILSEAKDLVNKILRSLRSPRMTEKIEFYKDLRPNNKKNQN